MTDACTYPVGDCVCAASATASPASERMARAIDAALIYMQGSGEVMQERVGDELRASAIAYRAAPDSAPVPDGAASDLVGPLPSWRDISLNLRGFAKVSDSRGGAPLVSERYRIAADYVEQAAARIKRLEAEITRLRRIEMAAHAYCTAVVQDDTEQQRSAAKWLRDALGD